MRTWTGRSISKRIACWVVAGRFDEGAALRLVAAKFGPLRAPTTPLAKTYTEEQVAVGYHTPAGAHPDSAPIDLMAQMLREPSFPAAEFDAVRPSARSRKKRRS